jgi:hypothetical protein
VGRHALDPVVKIFVWRKDNLISADGHIATNHADNDYKPASQGKRPRGEPIGSETFFVVFLKQIPAQTAVPARSEAAVPAPLAEPPPAAEQTPETEPQTG